MALTPFIASDATASSGPVLVSVHYLDLQNSYHVFIYLSNGELSTVVGPSNVDQYYILGPE